MPNSGVPVPAERVPTPAQRVPAAPEQSAPEDRVPLHLVPTAELRFRELFDSHFRELLGYALRRSGSAEDAADVVAETMLVAWRRSDQVPPDETARLWLYGVARRVLANHRRGQVRRERLGELLRSQLENITPDHAGDVEVNTVILQAMKGLSEPDRELIMLTTWEHLDPQQTAVVLGVPARTVRTRLHRARTRLRKHLGDAFVDRGHVRDDLPTQPAKEER
jgi:RNA polymerase sigma-70 factor (ECF subfamily)